MKEHSPKREQPSPTQDAPLSIWGGVRTCPPNSRGRGSAEAAGAPRSAWWIPSGRVGSVPFLNHLGTGEAWLALVVKNLPANAGDVRDVGSIAGSERPPGGGNGNPLQRSCLENPKDRGTWWATVHGVAKSWTRLRQFSAHAGMRLSLGQPDCKDQSGCQRVQSATAPGF